MMTEQTATHWTDRVRAWHLALLFLLLVLPGLGSTALMEPDEGRYAEIPREMLVSGDFVTPRLNGVLYFEKPPLYYWLCAGSIATFGKNEFAARAVSALMALAGVLLTFFLGRSMSGHRVGVYGALVVAVSPLWILLGRTNAIDMTLSTLILAALACFWWASREDGPRRLLAWHGLAAASALAVLTKGLIGIVIPGAIIFFYILFARRWTLLKRVPWISGILLFAAVAVPWHVLVARRNPSFLWFYFIHEHLMRYTTTVHARTAPWWFFVPVLLVGIIPWSGLLPASVKLFARNEEGRRRDEAIYLACWSGFIFLFFSASSSKLIPYMLPTVPALALLAAMALDRAEREGVARKAGAYGIGVMATILGLTLAGLGCVAAGLVPVRDIEIFRPLAVVAAGLGIIAIAAAFVWLGRSDWTRAIQALFATGAALACVFAVAAGPAAEYRTAHPLGHYLRRQGHPDWPIASFKNYPQSLPFYTGRLITVVGYDGELAFGISQLSAEEHARRFPSIDDFRVHWNSDEPMYLVVDPGKPGSMEAAGLRPGTRLVSTRKFTLLSNERVPGPGATSTPTAAPSRPSAP